MNRLKSEIEAAAYMIASNEARDKVHAKLLNCLVLLNKIEEPASSTKPKPDETQEITKVARRLKIWSKTGKQRQKNSQILNAYLELSDNGKVEVTEQQIESFLGNPTWFSSNFTQMKAIAEKNHGKLFAVSGDKVSIWPPVKRYVDEYCKSISQK